MVNPHFLIFGLMGSPSCNPTFMMPRQVPPVSSLVNGRRDEPDEVGIGRWIQVVPWFRLSDPFLAYNWRSKISAPRKFGDVPIWLMVSFFFCILFAMMFPIGKCFSWALKRRQQWLDPSCTLGVSRSSCGKWPSCRTPWCSRLRVHAPSERWPDQMHHYLDLLSLCFLFSISLPSIWGIYQSLFHNIVKQIQDEWLYHTILETFGGIIPGMVGGDWVPAFRLVLCWGTKQQIQRYGGLSELAFRSVKNSSRLVASNLVACLWAILRPFLAFLQLWFQGKSGLGCRSIGSLTLLRIELSGLTQFVCRIIKASLFWPLTFSGKAHLVQKPWTDWIRRQDAGARWCDKLSGLST